MTGNPRAQIRALQQNQNSRLASRPVVSESRGSVLARQAALFNGKIRQGETGRLALRRHEAGEAAPAGR